MKYVISYIRFFDNNLHIEFVLASSELEAGKLAYKKVTGIDYEGEDSSTLEDVKQAAFDCDAMIGVRAFFSLVPEPL
jgi:hypothetical protein